MKTKSKIRIAAITALLAVCLSAFFGCAGSGAYALTKVKYPKMSKYPSGLSLNSESAYDKWNEDRQTQTNQYEGYDQGLGEYYIKTARQLLGSADNENAIYSPLNIYVALAMLAETTDGNSRAEILKLLGVDSMENLRKKTDAIWNANYCDDGTVTSVLASSLWMDKSIDYNKETLKTLTDFYHASTFAGKMGDSNYSAALRSWLNEQTGNMLKDSVDNLNFDPETVMAIATTVYFKAKWDDEFKETGNKEAIFHGVSGDKNCIFMNQQSHGMYYYGEKFGAAYRRLENSGKMWFILPDEGVSINELLESEAIEKFFASDKEWASSKYIKINMSLPKFDINSDITLDDCLKNLGLNDIFNPQKSDFSPLVGNSRRLALSSAKHAARIIVDEVGVTGTSYTLLPMAGAAEPPKDEVDFVLDRPFIFVITGQTDMPLFIGVVNNVG